MTDPGTEGAQCWRCETPVEATGTDAKCLDCGRRYDVAPNGDLVRSRRVWWATRLAWVPIFTLLLAAVVVSALQSDWLGLAVSLAFSAIVVPLEAPELVEAIRHV